MKKNRRDETRACTETIEKRGLVREAETPVYKPEVV
jgi:hypothetical protein